MRPEHRLMGVPRAAEGGDSPHENQPPPAGRPGGPAAARGLLLEGSLL
jgi:hypothetical protein